MGEVLAAAAEVAAARREGPTRAELSRCLADLLGLDRLQLLLQHDRPLAAAERAAFRRRLQRMLDGEPLAYVLGKQEFYGRVFQVDRSVLIPRPETELLVELAVAKLPRAAAVFEPCTGSGCVALALALERPDLTVVASDVDETALEVARRNRRSLAADIELLAGDFFEPVAGRSFDALVANPPYVDPSKPGLLADRVRRFEPHRALFSPPGEPLHAYIRLLEGGVTGLAPGGLLLLEVGVDTADRVLDLATRSRSYENGVIHLDLAGRPRVVECRRCGS